LSLFRHRSLDDADNCSSCGELRKIGSVLASLREARGEALQQLQ
jgi:hypothetical protein